ncbi:MAG: inverse autotransporter beta domain-containing protein [Proteobacteria bacterium]|nr:inverse autotransporter beta domain-containing protein [Pseudomonadota bacterium]
MLNRLLSISKNYLIAVFTLLTLLVCSFSFAQNTISSDSNSSNIPPISEAKPLIILPDSDFGFQEAEQKNHQYSKLEKDIAQELVNMGQALEGNPNLEDVLSILKSRLTSKANSLLFERTNGSTQFIYDTVLKYLPKLNNKMANAAIEASSKEMFKGGSNMAKNFARSAISQSGFQGSYDISNDLQLVYLASSLEGIKAAAGASTLDILNRLELEYILNDSSLEEYSVLTMQPLWDSKDLRHNVFAQVSYFNKESRDIFADPEDYRHTGNAGLAYRYITPNEQHMFGFNAFFDHQWPYHHNRISVGLDYKNTLIGVSANKYVGLSDWRRRGDGFEEIVLDGEDIEFSGRFPKLPELELFAKGYHWNQGVTQVLNPDGSDIYGYKLTAEYTPLNGITVSSSIRNDNVTEDAEAQIMFRLNYVFGKGIKYLFERPEYNLDSVLDRRYDKVRRNNDIRVQVRQELDITAVVTYAQGANVSLGQSIAIGTTITTGGSVGDAATVEFGNGARLDIGQSTQVRVEADRLVLITGIIQFTSGTGGITTINVPNGTINLIGTDVDVRVSGTSNTLRVRDGSADFTDDSGTTRVNAEELVESLFGDGVIPQIRAEGTSIYDTHETEAYAQLNLVGPEASNNSAAPYATSAVTVSGTLASGNTLTFTVPLSRAVTVTGVPQLAFTLAGSDRLAGYSSGSGTESLIFTYNVVGADETLSNIEVDIINKNGGTLTSSNGIAMIRKVSGSLSGTIPDATAPTISTLTATSSGGDPAGIGDVITVTLDATEALTQSGTPTLTLDIGGTSRTANFSAINSGNAEFTYTVVSGDNDADGVTVTAITVAADELEDSSGNDLNTTFTLPHNLSLDVSTVIMGLTACPSGDLGDDDVNDDTNHGCARLFGSDPTDMDDVMVFAGNVPGTTTDFFVRRCDLSQDYDAVDDRCEYSDGNATTRDTYQWKDVNTESAVAYATDLGAWTQTSAIDGPGLTATLVADGSGTHAAAETCNALGAGWYLPAISELDVIYANLIGTDDPDHPLPTVNNPADVTNSGTTGPLRTGAWYWSSSERNSANAWIQRFTDGTQGGNSKANTSVVRCARR